MNPGISFPIGRLPDHYVRKRIYAMGATLEVNYRNLAPTGAANWSLQKVRIYVPGPDGVIGAREFDPAKPIGQQETALVYHYDHLGSIDCITPFGSTATSFASDQAGKPGRFSEDAWGQRRDPTDWQGPPTTTDDGGSDSLTPRGFTGHEMLDDLGLVHMNGRIYDPLLGRMLSADLVVQNPGSLQCYNRYSYVLNNPLTLTDPTGFYFMENLPTWAQSGLNAVTYGGAGAVDQLLDAGQESESVYNQLRGQGEGVVSAHSTALAVGITRLTGAMDWAEAVHGQKIVADPRGGVTVQDITDPKEIVIKAVGGSAGMVLTATGGAKLLETRVSKAAPEARLTTEVKTSTAPTTEAAQAKGGTYKLVDADGNVKRTGRTNDLARREGEHARAEATRDLKFEVDKRTDSHTEQRGREHRLYEEHPEAKVENGGLNKVKPIADRNPKKKMYLEAADAIQ